MVVVLHFNNAGIGKAFTFTEGLFNHKLLKALEVVSIPAVDTFIIISGYFGFSKNSFRISNAVKLIIQTILLQIFAYFIRVTAGEALTFAKLAGCFLVTNYYVCLYVALMLISPYINYIFRKLSYKGTKTLLTVLMLTFSAYPYCTDIYERIVGNDWLVSVL